MHLYTVDVSMATHDDLQRGDTATRLSRIRLLASDDVDAVHTACALAHATAGSDFLPTGADLIDFPLDWLPWSHPVD